MTARGYFVALLLAVLLPALGLTAGLIWWHAKGEDERQQQILRDFARTLIQAVDREMRVAIASLRRCATHSGCSGRTSRGSPR
jgi:hypothetical protein